MIVQLVRWCFKPMPKNTADGGRNPPSRSRFRVHHNVRRSASAVTENCKDNKREDSPQTDTEDDHSILRKEVEAVMQSLKKGKSAGVDNIPVELVQEGGEDVITALTTICNKIWQTGEWPTPWTQSLVITLPKKRQPAAVPEQPNGQPHQ